jgi:hypothetical protein
MVEQQNNAATAARKICIKISDSEADGLCALCGCSVERDIGPNLYLDGTDKLVCPDCVGEAEPLLERMIIWQLEKKLEWLKEETARLEAGDFSELGEILKEEQTVVH